MECPVCHHHPRVKLSAIGGGDKTQVEYVRDGRNKIPNYERKQARSFPRLSDRDMDALERGQAHLTRKGKRIILVYV